MKSFIILVLGFCIILSSCKKEYSLENLTKGAVEGTTGGTAVYTLEGSPGICTPAFLSGIYIAGTAMTPVNTVVLSANVTVPGTYTITTSTANGIKFTGTGSFTSIGVQFVELVASGTPAVQGIFNYNEGTNGCSFPVIFADTGGGASGGTAVFTFNGSPNCSPTTVNGIYAVGMALDAGNTVVITANVTTAGTYTISTGSANGITFSGSGTLSVGANQTITLTGSGIPAAIGTNSYMPGRNGCAFAITTVIGKSEFLRATISGVFTQFNYNLFGAIDNKAAGPSNLFIFGQLSSAVGNDGFSIQFNNTTGLITTGTYNLSIANQTKFATFSYIDNAGTIWIPSPVTASDLTCTITSLTATSTAGTFSGTLNPVTATGIGTATKVITNGSFSITF